MYDQDSQIISKMYPERIETNSKIAGARLRLRDALI